MILITIYLLSLPLIATLNALLEWLLSKLCKLPWMCICFLFVITYFFCLSVALFALAL